MMAKVKKDEPVRRKEVRKDDQVRIRVTAEQKAILAEAAESTGLGVSSWMLSIGLKEAETMRVARRNSKG